MAKIINTVQYTAELSKIFEKNHTRFSYFVRSFHNSAYTIYKKEQDITESLYEMAYKKLEDMLNVNITDAQKTKIRIILKKLRVSAYKKHKYDSSILRQSTIKEIKKCEKTFLDRILSFFNFKK